MKINKQTVTILLSITFLFFCDNSYAFYNNLKSTDKICLKTNNFKIIFSDKEENPLKIALKALQKDFLRVMNFQPIVVNTIDADTKTPQIIIVNRSSGHTVVPSKIKKELDGFESHRIYTDKKNNRIYVEGYDVRGTIYAIYTFSEQFLEVPPLHYWSSWIPAKKEEILISKSYDLFFKSPKVRYRSILPGDQDFFIPWKKASKENNNIWLETTLRLKMNTVEAYSTIQPKSKLTNYAYLIDAYGLVLTSHHIAGLNTSFSTWEKYWKKERKMEVPALLLSNEKEIIEFFRYNAETVQKNGIENLWTIAFRGKKDQPFWSVFKDAPKTDKERAEVINKMHQIQLNIIKEVTQNPSPYVRITFYDELADLMSKGYLKPPESKNIIWTYVAARRDPYPYTDLVNFKSDKPVKLGYYMNFGFASTGAHVAPAESPWKMEFNYRYINNKSSLYFSVVNVGNFREFLLELSAHANMMWNFDNYKTDDFILYYSKQYFGVKYATEIAKLYHNFYNAYWQPKATVFKGMERQFVFQDLRYARAFDHIYEKFYTSKKEVNLNPLHKIGYEREKGRTFRIDVEHNNSTNQIDAILNGMQKTIPKFEVVATECSRIMPLLENKKQTYFNDNLRVYGYYMLHLSKTLQHFILAYKYQKNKKILLENLDLAYNEAVKAQNYLLESQHGIFSKWYTDADPLKRTFQIDILQKRILLLKEKASK